MVSSLGVSPNGTVYEETLSHRKALLVRNVVFLTAPVGMRVVIETKWSIHNDICDLLTLPLGLSRRLMRFLELFLVGATRHCPQEGLSRPHPKRASIAALVQRHVVR
jgi:hypothetical protein